MLLNIWTVKNLPRLSASDAEGGDYSGWVFYTKTILNSASTAVTLVVRENTLLLPEKNHTTSQSYKNAMGFTPRSSIRYAHRPVKITVFYVCTIQYLLVFGRRNICVFSVKNNR